MSETKVAAVEHGSLAKGLIAGLIGGLVGTVAKRYAEMAFPPRLEGSPEPWDRAADRVAEQLVAAEIVAEDALTLDTKARLGEGLRWGLYVGAGAAYGAIAEFYPEATVRRGASFGLVLESLVHEGALPALGLGAEPESQRERGGEIASYGVYGVATEMVRRLVRRCL